MSTSSSETAPKRKRNATKTPSTKTKSRSSGKSKPNPAVTKVEAEVAPLEVEARVTKQESVLTLLSRPAGASIEEMMQATGWQQHSVRGFLAGTVKKKLGFSLSSSKPEGEARRYRIEKRGR